MSQIPAPRVNYPGPLHFPRWQLSQVSHPGDVQDVKFPTHLCFTKPNSSGLPRRPPQQTIDRCINVLPCINIEEYLNLMRRNYRLEQRKYLLWGTFVFQPNHLAFIYGWKWMQGCIAVKWPQDGYGTRELHDRHLVFEMNLFPSIVELYPPLPRLVHDQR